MSEARFYHSFPRRLKSRRAATDISLGLSILRSIFANGLLLTPEVPPVVGMANPPIQKRICFTLLAPKELPAHSKRFGDFALEFSNKSLRKLGAFPVFYIPSKINPNDLSGAGLELFEKLQILEQLMLSITALKNKNQSIVIRAINTQLKRDGTSPEELRWTSKAVQNLFYPTNNPEYTTGLHEYYEQREWKIIESFARNTSTGPEWDFHPLSDPQKIELLVQNPGFFQKKTGSAEQRRVDLCMVYPKIGKRRVVSLISRVIVPHEAVKAARRIVAKGTPRGRKKIPVVSIERISRRKIS